MNIEALFMMLPVLTAAVYKENIGFIYLGVAVVCGLLGIACTRKKPKTKMFFAREGFVTVSLGWIVLSFFGCMPFVISGEIPHIIDAMFEIVSGFTTCLLYTSDIQIDNSHWLATLFRNPTDIQVEFIAVSQISQRIVIA